MKSATDIESALECAFDEGLDEAACHHPWLVLSMIKAAYDQREDPVVFLRTFPSEPALSLMCETPEGYFAAIVAWLVGAPIDNSKIDECIAISVNEFNEFWWPQIESQTEIPQGMFYAAIDMFINRAATA